jgi:ATPase subunit of ABC transporter with duplicated ATPase domains
MKNTTASRPALKPRAVTICGENQHVLTGMGFSGFDRRMPASALSGGEQARLAICKLLCRTRICCFWMR